MHAVTQLPDAACCAPKFRLLPERPEKAHRKLSATERAAMQVDAAAASDGWKRRGFRAWLPWRRVSYDADTVTAPSADLADQPEAGGAGLVVSGKAEDSSATPAVRVTVDAVEMQGSPAP